MGKLKRAVMILLIIAMAATLALFGYYMVSQKKAGGITPMYHISPEGRAFIAEEFGHCQSLAELLETVEAYEMQHFTYDHNYRMPVVQNFDFDTFLKAETGVCWELAAFAKCVIGEICAMKDWQVANYVVDIRFKDDFFKTHSYNYVIAEDGIYVFDPTSTVNNQKSWLHRIDGDSLDEVYAYADSLGETVYRVQ